MKDNLKEGVCKDQYVDREALPVSHQLSEIFLSEPDEGSEIISIYIVVRARNGARLFMSTVAADATILSFNHSPLPPL